MVYENIGKLLGCDFNVDKELSENPHFMIGASRVCGMLRGALLSLENKENVQLVSEFLTDFIADIQRGKDDGVFEPASADNIIAKAKEKLTEALTLVGTPQELLN